VAGEALSLPPWVIQVGERSVSASSRWFFVAARLVSDPRTAWLMPPGRSRAGWRLVSTSQHPSLREACRARVRRSISATRSSLAALSLRSALARKYSYSAQAAASALINGGSGTGEFTRCPWGRGRKGYRPR